MQFRTLLLSFILALLSISFIASAEDRGRLPDGRAFRTDGEGNQLVDYIAELELNVDALTRKVRTLEDELQGGTTAATDNTTTSARCPETQCPPVDCSLEVAKAQKVSSENESFIENELNHERVRCAQEISRIQASSAALRADLATKNEQFRAYQNQDSHSAAEKGNAAALLEVKNGEIAAIREKIRNAQLEGDGLESSLASKRDEIDVLKMKISDMENEAGDLEAKLEEMKDRRKTLEVQNAAFAKVISEVERRNEEYSKKSEESRTAFYRPSRPSSGDERASMSFSRMNALDSLRGSMMTNLNQIQSLISARDKMYSEYSKRTHTVKFRPSMPMSARRLSFNEVKSRLQSADTGRELSLLSRDISDIRSRIESDIALMKRMSKLDGSEQ